MKFFSLVISLILLCLCTKQPKFKNSDDFKNEVPLQEFTGNTRLVLSDSGKTVWILNTAYMAKQKEGGKTISKPVEFDYYAGKPEPLSHLTADYGEAEGRSFESFFVKGNVRVNSSKGYKLKAENLRFDKKANQITSDATVEFTTLQGDVLIGKGFESDPDLENWKILKDVRGKFQKFERRMDEGTL